MKIFIPTYDRHRQELAKTLGNWPKHLPVTMAVRPEELPRYLMLATNLGLKRYDA